MGYEPKWLKDLRKRKGGPRVIAKYNPPPRAENEGLRLPDFIHEREGDYFRLDVPQPMAYVRCVQVPREHGTHRMDEATNRCDLCGMTQRAMVDAADEAGTPGAACRPTSLWYCDPLGHWGCVPVLRFVEEDDGSMTITGLIDNAGPYHPVWRGYLTRGFWVGEGVQVG